MRTYIHSFKITWFFVRLAQPCSSCELLVVAMAEARYVGEVSSPALKPRVFKVASTPGHRSSVCIASQRSCTHAGAALGFWMLYVAQDDSPSSESSRMCSKLPPALLYAAKYALLKMVSFAIARSNQMPVKLHRPFFWNFG